ncbi:protein kinase domain-containing protein [Nocardia gamkensis]|uniref:protein kinase domain-containing protein n=1 Tax=Nocardia gamkensis TaxID=352869 RepID=UPI0020B85A34|nr:protein kinase [Nocardia gamkensis]
MSTVWTPRNLVRRGPAVLPARRAVRIVAGAARGLDAAHRGGLLHRDVKPANILVSTADDGSDAVRITDFGIARSMDACAAKTTASTGMCGRSGVGTLGATRRSRPISTTTPRARTPGADRPDPGGCAGVTTRAATRDCSQPDSTIRRGRGSSSTCPGITTPARTSSTTGGKRRRCEPRRAPVAPADGG